MKRRVRWFDGLFLAVLMLYILAGAASVPFHGDEATLIYMSHDYAYQFQRRDLSLVTYHDPPISAQEQFLRLINGSVSKYAIGLAWHLAGFSEDDLNEQWDWGADWHYNQTTGHAPSPELLNAARIPSALMLALGVLPMYGLGAQIGGRATGLLAALLYALHPALLLNGRRAMMEGALTLFSLLTVLAAVIYARAASLRARWGWSAALGLCAGMALASKHTAVFIVAATFAACAWAALRRDARRVVQIALAGALTFGVFYALNPVWWGDPLARAAQVLRERSALLAGQTAAFGGYDGLPDALAGFLRQVLIAQPQYYEVPAWSEYIGDQIAQYEALPWRGVVYGGSVVGAVVFTALIGLGGWALWRTRRNIGAFPIIALWTLGSCGSALLLTPVEWQRYYLITYPPLILLTARGITAAVTAQRWRSPAVSAPVSS